MGIQLVSRRVMRWDHSLSHRVEPGGSNHLISGYLGAWLHLCAGSVQFNWLIKRYVLVTIVHLVHVTLCHAPSDVKLCGSMPSASK